MNEVGFCGVTTHVIVTTNNLCVCGGLPPLLLLLVLVIGWTWTLAIS